MKWLKNIFSKKKKMNLQDKSIEELREDLSKMDYVWVKSDQMGNTEKYKDIEKDESTGMTFLTFNSGRRINLDLLNEYMDSFPASPVDFGKDIEPTSPDRINAIPSTQQDISPKREKNTVSSVQVEDSPIYTLLKKQKNNWVNVSISLKLNLPPKSLYSVLISSFDEAETEIVDYVTEGIDIEDIRAALGESILAYYDKNKSTRSVVKEDESE
jgi:hypothetical protein